MRIGIHMVTDHPSSTIDGFVAKVRQIEQEGFATAWFNNVFGFDAMTVASLCGSVTSRIEVGVAVVPIQSRHPVTMAQQALSTQAAVRGRFTLGIGVSHPHRVEGVFGLSFERPYADMSEYLRILAPLIRGGRTDYERNSKSAHAELSITGVAACPILMAALGPRMLGLAGQMCDGTITWMTGPKTLSTFTVPRISAAASEAGRPSPRIVAGFPVAVASDATEAYGTASRLMAAWATMPSYKAMLDREGVDSPADVTIIGDEDGVAEQLLRLGEIGVTDVFAFPIPIGGDTQGSLERTQGLLAKLANSVYAEH